MPVSPNSSHPDLQTLHLALATFAVPLHTVQVTSTSKEGSVNWKWWGRRRPSIFRGPKYSLTKWSRVPFKWVMFISWSTQRPQTEKHRSVTCIPVWTIGLGNIYHTNRRSAYSPHLPDLTWRSMRGEKHFPHLGWIGASMNEVSKSSLAAWLWAYLKTQMKKFILYLRIWCPDEANLFIDPADFLDGNRYQMDTSFWVWRSW